MANCLYSGDKPLGIVQSNAEDVAYDNDISVKEAIDGVVVKSIPANTYSTWALALAEIKTYFDNLTTEEKLRSKIIMGQTIFFFSRFSDSSFATTMVATTAISIKSLYLNSAGSQFYVSAGINASQTTFNNLSSNAQNESLELIV